MKSMNQEHKKNKFSFVSKLVKALSLFLIFLLVSCNAVRVNSDYDKNANFSQYKTYAYNKTGIDKVEISDLDKKRILHAIDDQLLAKGYTKSDTPDLFVNFFTKEREQVNVGSYGWGMGYGWGYSPWMYGGYGGNYVNRYVEGTLYIDIIDAKKKELIWQGEGVGALTQNVNKKDERVKEFVTRILEQYPPIIKK